LHRMSTPITSVKMFNDCAAYHKNEREKMEFYTKYPLPWWDKYNEAKAFYDKHRNLTFTSDKKHLRVWLSRQRRQEAKLELPHVKALNEIGYMEKNHRGKDRARDTRNIRKLKDLVEKKMDGKGQDANDKSIRSWLSRQRVKYRKGMLSKYVTDELVNMEICLHGAPKAASATCRKIINPPSPDDEDMKKKYRVLQNFVQKYGHAQVPRDHPLGNWIVTLRNRMKRGGIHGSVGEVWKERLDSLDFVWDCGGKKRKSSGVIVSVANQGENLMKWVRKPLTKYDEDKLCKLYYNTDCAREDWCEEERLRTGGDLEEMKVVNLPGYGWILRKAFRRLASDEKKAKEFRKQKKIQQGVYVEECEEEVEGLWMDDSVVNGFLKLVSKRYGGREAGLCIVGSVFANQLFAIDPKYGKLNKFDYEGITAGTKRKQFPEGDIFKAKIVIIPVNVANNHWIMVMVSVEEKRIQVYDSNSMAKKYNKVGKWVYKFLEKERLRLHKEELEGWEWCVAMMTDPKQVNRKCDN